MKSSFTTNSSFLATISSITFLAIAGDEASPGDSIPTTLIKFSVSDSSIIKSWVEGVALNPANVLIVS